MSLLYFSRFIPNCADGVGVVLNNFVKYKYIMTRKNEKNSFVFYDSFMSAMKHLNDAEFRECVLKIRDYALEGVDEESSSPMVNVIMAMAKPNLDSARRRYMASVENGKKGAEYGKLGGAPKGNQNARKKQPLKQPLDEDVNVDVEEDVNEEVNVNVNGDDDGDNPSGTIGLQSSFSNSSIGFQEEEIENDSERLEEREENNESNLGLDFKGFEFVAASEEMGETPIYSKDDNSNSASSPCSEEGAGSSAARTRQQKEPGMSIDEYNQMCFEKNIDKLVLMRLGKIPNDDSLFWRTVELHKRIFRNNDEQIAVMALHQAIKELCNDSN